MLNAAAETASKPPVYNPPLPARPDQAGGPDDFGALVDSNVNAASSASQFQPPAPSRQPAPNDNQDNPPPPSRNDAPASASNSQQQPDSPPPAKDVPPASSAGNSSQADSSASHSKPKDKNAKADDSSSSATAETTNQTSDPVAVVVAAAAQVQTEVKSSGKDAGTVDGDATKTKTATPQTMMFSAETKTAEANGKPSTGAAAGQATAESSKTDGEKAPQVAADAAMPQVVTGMNGAPTDATAANGTHQASAGKPGVKGASTQKTATTGQQATAKTEAVNQQQDAASAAAQNGDSDPQFGNNAKPNTLSVKADATSAPASAAHDHRDAEAPSLKPDTNFQSFLDLQSQPLAQPAQTNNFTVTAAGPSASAQALDAPVPVSGLAVDIATKAAAGNTKFQISLDPAELGRIDVRLDVDKHGQVTSHLTVERPATLDMLRNDAPKLQQALEDAGFKTGDGGLQFSLRDQSAQNGGNYNDGSQNRNAQRLVISEDTSTAAQAANATYGSLRSSRGGVDISI